MTLLSRLRRIVAFLLIVLILFTYCDILAFADTQGSDTQGPVVNKAVTVKVAPPEGGEVIKSGEPGSFVIEATISNPTTGANVEITINLPDSLPTEYLTQFKENDTITYSGVDITLDRDKRTLSLTISGEGQGAQIPIAFQFPNGITPNGFNVEIKETDIAIKTEIVGNQEIEGGRVTVNSEFSWNGVSKDSKTAGILTGKTVRPDNDPDNEYYELTTDLDYEISAISNNGGSASGDRFTKELTLNDKMTLPEGLYFAYDDGKGLSVGVTDSKWQILNDTKVIAEITKPEERDNFSYEITEPAITKAENGINDVLSFNYVQKYTGDLAEYKSEMSNVDVNVSVKKDAVRIEDLMAIEGKVIENRVDMEAVPIDETDKHTSYDIESLTLSDPGQFFTVKKRSAVGTEDGKMVIDYTISIENASDVPLYNLTIEDILPSNVELLEVPEGAVYDAAARKLTWTGENIDYQGTLLKTLKVRVKDSAVAGTNIINTARATVDGDNWQSSTVTDKVYTPKADVSINKSHNKGVAANVLPGETVEYKVAVKNSGLGQASCTITDTFASSYLTNLRNFKYSIDGTNWYTLTGYTIEDNKITFCTDKILDNNPATTANPTIYYKYEATVSQDAPAEVFINNTASVAWEDGKEDSTASISVRQRLPKVTIEKDAENPVAESSSWYKVDYSLVVKNEGDEVVAEDNLQIVDTMSGGLLPVKNPLTSGTITGTYIDNSGTSESITGSYTEVTDGIYKVVWNVKPMAAGTSAKPSQAKILYPAYIQVPDYGEGAGIDEVLCAVNKAELLLRGKPSGTISINTPMNPVPVPNKIISKLNGSLTNPSTCEIKPGDQVEYTITIANTGSSSMTVEVLDTLPQPFIGSGFAWVLEENLQLIDNQLGTPELDQTAGTLTWKNVVVAPGATKIVKVVLTFPEVEKFNAAFAPSSGQRYIYNKLQVIGPDPDKPWVKKVYNSQVSHNIKAVILNVEKTATPSELVPGGEEVTFTLNGFGTEEAAANLSLADDLTKVADYMDLKTINTGAYSGISSYDIILSYESWMPDKVIHVTDASVNNVITDSADYPFTGVTGVTWNFGTVDYLTVNFNPTIKMVVKEDVSGSADNGVTLYYNGKTAEDSVPVSFIPDKILEKTAMVNGKEVNNTDNQLQEGDRVTFHIYYVNPSEAESVKLDNSNPMIDYLTTKGLEAENGIQVSWDVHDSRNLLKSGYTVTPGSFDITEDDIASSDAKKISFTLNKALEPGDKLHISYTVTVGNGIAYSQGEHNKGYEDGWGYDGSSLDTNPSNLHLLHNRVTSKYGSGTTSAETGFYYAPGKNNLYFSKAVRGFSTYSKVYVYKNGKQYFMDAYTGLESGKDLNNFGNSRTYKNPKNQKYEQTRDTDRFDVIFYVVTVANDLSSNSTLNVRNIEDTLPVNTVRYNTKILAHKPGYGKTNATVQFGLLYNEQNAKNKLVSLSSGTYTSPVLSDGNASDASYNQFNGKSYCQITAEDTAKVTSIPNGYTAVDVKMDINNYAALNPTFRVFSDVNNRNAGVTLKPGEMFAFTYAVIIDRTKTEPRSWLNTATLNVTNTDFSIRGNLPADEDQFITVTNNATKLNISEGVRKTETSYVAAPAVVGPQYKAGITKTAVGYASDSSGATLDEVKEYTYSTDMGNVKFGDIVKWKIVATNSGNTNITGATLKDLIPYPYEVITGSGGEVATDYEGTMVAGTVTNSAGATYGEAGQTVTISGVNINADTTTYNATKTYYIYTRYTGSEYKSLSYTNRAELYVNGNFTPTIGQPIYDEDDRTTVIGIAAEDLIYPTLDGSSDSYKEVWEGEVPDNRGQGNTPNNSITVSSLSSTVKYRLNLKNTGSLPYTDVVLIDKLPHVGDTGVVNAVAQRGSQFDVALKSADMTVKIIGTDNSERVLTSGTDYTVGFSTEKGDSGFSSAAWASGTGFTDTPPTSSTKSFRLALKVPLAVGEKLTVEFDAQLPEDSPGKTAWNNFGYSYKTGGNTLYAEPAKVGVTVEEQSLTVNKVWKDGTGEGTRPANLTISLYKQVGDGEKQLIKKYTNLAWEKSGNQWTYTFTGLPAKENGETLTYSVSETVPTGYVSAVRSDGSGVSITNSLVTQISGTKIWMDGLEDHAIRPYILLYKVVNGEKTPVSYLPDQIKWTDGTVPEGAGEMVKDIDVFTISGLPAYDENNNLITYVIDESDYPGYVLVSNSNNNLVNVRYDTTEISITKVWKDNNNQDNTRPGTIMLQVYADLKPYGEEIAVTSANVDPDDQNQWKYTIKNLPKYSEKDGHEISYSVKEVSDGSTPYESLITYGEDGGIVITNTIVGYTTIKVKKLWDDSDNKAGDRPAKLDVTVTRSLVGDADSTPVEYGLTLTAADGWEAALSGLPLYDDDGRPYEYDVTEEEVPSYFLEGEIQKAESTDADGNKVVTYMFTNKREEPTPTSLVIKARKIFDAEEGVDVKITDFKFSLTPLKYDEASAQWIEDGTAGTQIKKADADGNITFDEIEYDLAGTYMYLMKEVIPTVGEEGFNVSVDYDESEVYVKVVVVQEGSALITKVTYDEPGEDWSEEKPPEFINIYSEPDDIFADFYVRKDFFDSEGNRLSFGDYQFSAQLKALTTGAPMPEGSVSDEDPDGAVTKTLFLTDEESEGASLISFGAITYGADNIGKTYEYQITEVVPPAGIRDYSVQYDPAVYKVSVTISKKTDANELEAAIIWTKDGVPVIDELAAFENIYEVPDEGQAVLSVLKQLEGRDGRPISEGEFTFQLYDSEGKLLQTVTTRADGRAVFAALKFTEDVGIDGKTYTFTIKEQNTGAPTIIYSDETVYAKVLVTKDENNKLVTSVTYSKTENGTYTENEQTITNTFIHPDYLNFRIKKAVTGEGADIGAPLGIGQYSFTLMQIKEDGSTVPVGLPVNNGSVPAGYTGTVSAEDVIFPQIEFTEAGKYTYEIREVIPAENTGIPGITYSQEAIKVVVSVTAEGNQLKATAEYYYKADEDSEYTKLTEADPTITNKYDLPPDIKVDLQAKKNLNDSQTEKEISFEVGDFTFELRDAEGNIVPGFEAVTNDGDGNVTFKNVPVNLGDNIFRIREVDGGKPGYTYDYSEYVAVVKTCLKGDGTNSLEWVSTTYYKSYTNETENIPLTDAGGNPSIPVFENKYEQPDPSSVDLKINKVLIGKEYSDEIFTFVLTATEGTGTPDPAESGSVVVRGPAGEISFEDIKIEKVGTYYYTISEMMPEEPNPNIEYSTEKIYAKVVAKDVDNVLTMTVTYSKTDSKVSDGTASSDIQTITNKYVAPTTAAITVNKVITGEGAPEIISDQFSFILTPLTNSDGLKAPSPAGAAEDGIKTVSNDKYGNVNFGDISFEEVGTYEYEITELPPDMTAPDFNPSIKHDNGKIIATVLVFRSTTKPELAATVTYKYVSEDGTKITEGSKTFTNKYEAPEETNAQLKAEKVLEGNGGGSDTFNFELRKAGEEAVLQTKSGGAGTITFDAISFTEPGEYLYTIMEAAGTNPSIEYSDEIIYAKVVVTKNSDNQLVPTVTYSKNKPDVSDGTADIQTITNTYTAPTSAQLQIKKAMEGDSWQIGAPILPVQYSFRLTETTGGKDITVGVPIYNGSTPQGYTGTVDSEDVIFPSIRYTEAGTYTYEISENEGSLTGITYSSESIKVTVVVEKDAENHELYVDSISYTDKDGNTLTDPTIINTYTKPGNITTELSAKKELTGRNLEADEFSFELLDKDGYKILGYDPVANSADGSIIFENVSVTLGENIFIIKEVIPEVKDTSIDYDKTVYYAVVTTELDPDDKTKLKVVSTAYYTEYTDAENNTPITEDQPVFNNKYTPPDGTELTLEALKRYIDNADNSEKTLEAGKFKFMLYKDADRNEAIGEAVYNGADGKVTFEEISINEAGTYTYYIGEVVLKQGDEGYDQSVTYDDTLYVATVVVDKKDGTNELQVKSVEYAKADGSPLESGQTVPTFVNEYEKPNETTLKLEAQKSYNLPFSADEFAFTLTPQSGAPASANADATTGVETVGTLADGTEISSGDYQAGIEFSEITFDEPGDYIYIIEETKGSNSSISYDGEEITAKVHVYRHATYNYLVADVTYTKGGTSSNGKLTFENEYAAPAETSQSISLSKTFVDEDGDPIRFGDNVFRFKLEAVTPGAPVPDPSEVATTFNDKAVETLSFGEIKFTEDVGEEGKTYVYTISEVIPEDMASGKNPSVEYDENIITVEITVTKGTSGEEKNKLIASRPVYYDAAHNELDDGAIFTNKYEEPEKTDVILEFDKIYKELIDGAEVNRSLDGDDFSFTLTPEDGAPEPSDGQLTAKNNADGKIVFGKIEFTEDVGSAGKTYTYTVSENNSGYPSITYDDKPITVEITVTKDEYNNLQTSVVYKKGGEEITAADALGLYFKNVYEKPEQTTVQFDLTKVLKNADISKYTFDFTLTPQGDAPASQDADETGVETVQNTANGKISFSTITFGEDVDSKVYTYIIAEEKGTNPSIDYDDSLITVTVTVTKGTDDENKNKLMTSVQYTKDGSDVTDDPKFENTYNTPTPVTPAEKLKVTKRFGIIGEDGELQLKAFGTNVFKFSIEAVTEGAPLPDNTEITTTDANKAEEELFFGDIEFTEDVGSEGKTYEYLIKEVIPADRKSGKNPSVTYDEKVITAKITVTKNDHNDLVASAPEYFDASGAKLTEDVTFTNTYEEPEQVSQTFELTKLYTGKEFVGDDFEFVLKDSDGNELETVTNTVDGKITFTPITFTEDVEDGEKVYEYTITEVDKNYPSITYDGEPITVKVKVTKTDDNKLSAVTTYEKAGEDVTGSPSFSNTYTEPEPTSIVLQVAKEYKNGSKLKGGEFTFILRDNEGNEISTAVNDEDGNVVFDEIKYNADIDDETYHYTISELKGSKSDIVYDNKIIDVDVRVVKSPENKLTAEAKYYVEGEETDEPKFVNTYVPPVVGAFVNITADKVYKNGTLNGNDFKFMLEAEPGNPYNQTKYAYNDAMGNISFDYILFYTEGEYKFNITEVAGDNPDIKYDGGTVEVTVKVTRTQYGTLEASVEYAKDGEPGSTFINEYVNPDTITVNISTKKVLKGRELEGNEFNFMLTPLDGSPGEEYSVRNAADGTVAFREMTFDEEGIYRYRITELQLSKIPYVTYDDVPVDVTVTVIRNDEGRLTAKVAYSKAGASSNVFTNIYNCKEDDNNPKTGDVSGLLAHMILFSGSSVGLFTFMLSGRRRRKNEDDQPE